MYPEHFDTERLILRRFAQEDWRDLAAYGECRASIEFDRWENWPTDEAGCRSAAGYFAGADNCWAVARKADGAWLGFVTFNEVTGEGHLDMGHGFLYARLREGEAEEALGRMIDYAFTLPGITAVEARNPEGWTEQVAPVIALVFSEFRSGRLLVKS